MTLDPLAIDLLSRIPPVLTAPGKTGRILEADTPAPRLLALLDEIADTILPRVLRFEVTEQALDLTVGNARVIDLNAPGCPNWRELDREAQLVQTAGALRGFAGGAEPIRITSQRSGLTTAGDGIGCTCRDLRTHCENQGWLWDHPAPPEPEFTFEDALSATAIAIAEMALDGPVISTEGDADHLPDDVDLDAILADFKALDCQRGDPPSTEPTWLVIENTKRSTTSALALYATGKTVRVCVMASADIWPLTRIWAAERAQLMDTGLGAQDGR